MDTIKHRPARAPEPEWNTKHFSRLRGEMCNWLVPPRIQSMMTAVSRAQQTRDGTITLHYEDGTTESVKSERDMVREFDGFMALVGWVQSQRTGA